MARGSNGDRTDEGPAADRAASLRPRRAPNRSAAARLSGPRAAGTSDPTVPAARHRGRNDGCRRGRPRPGRSRRGPGVDHGRTGPNERRGAEVRTRTRWAADRPCRSADRATPRGRAVPALRVPIRDGLSVDRRSACRHRAGCRGPERRPRMSASTRRTVRADEDPATCAKSNLGKRQVERVGRHGWQVHLDVLHRDARADQVRRWCESLGVPAGTRLAMRIGTLPPRSACCALLGGHGPQGGDRAGPWSASKNSVNSTLPAVSRGRVDITCPSKSATWSVVGATTTSRSVPTTTPGSARLGERTRWPAGREVAFVAGAARSQGRSHTIALAREGADARDLAGSVHPTQADTPMITRSPAGGLHRRRDAPGRRRNPDQGDVSAPTGCTGPSRGGRRGSRPARRPALLGRQRRVGRDHVRTSR